MKFYLERYPANDRPAPVLVPRPEIAWEGGAVFNPGVVYDNGLFRMLYRTYPTVTTQSEQKRRDRPGYFLNNQKSWIGYAESTDGFSFTRRDTPFISPDMPYDCGGCEDPRITKIGDTFYITYTALDASLDEALPTRPGIRIALVTTKDFVTVTKHGIIGPPRRSKAAAFFPEPVAGGKTAFILTADSDSVLSHLALRYFDSLEQAMTLSEQGWEDFLATSQETASVKTAWWLDRGPELGGPPIKTDRGWLIVYAAEAMSATWTTAAALLDSENPHKLIARTPGSILQPATDYELNGLVKNVTFPSASVVVGDELYVYYGAADTVIGLARCKLNDLLDYIESFKNKT